MKTLHFDHFAVTKHEYTKSGLLQVTGSIAAVGNLPYVQKDGSVRWEEVSKETLFDPEHLRGIVGLPVTLEHPPEPISPGNYTKFSVGSVGDTVVANEDAGTIEVMFTIGDQKAISSIVEGKTTELSMGYWAQTEPIENKPGWFKQIKRDANHVSIVQKARGGPKLRLALDSHDSYSYLAIPGIMEPQKDEDQKVEKEIKIKMAKFTRDGITLEFTEAQVGMLKNWFDKQDGIVDALRKEVDSIKADSVSVPVNGNKVLVHKDVAEVLEASVSKVEVEKLQVQLDALTAELEATKLNKDNVLQAVKERRDLERKAFELIVRNDSTFSQDAFENLSDRNIKEKAISTKWDSFSPAYFASKSDEAITAMFELALELPREDSTTALKNSLSDVVTVDSVSTDLQAAQNEYANDIATSWQWVTKAQENNRR